MEVIEVGSIDPVRIDKFLALQFAPLFSRSYFSYLIDEELVLLNGKGVKKRAIVKPGDTIEVAFADTPESELIPEPIPLDILFEDNDIIVINKQANLVVHPAPGNFTGTLVNGLIHHVKTLQPEAGNLRPGIVHRLDKDTTGVMVAAKHSEAQRRLIEMFSKRKVKKEYLAVTFQKPKEGLLNTLIGRDPKDRKKMSVLEAGGKEAITHFSIKEEKPPLYLVHALIETGRTHQIRVHLKHLKAPVLGDPVYGSVSMNQKFKAERPYLHSFRLQINHPMSLESLTFEAPLPKDMQCGFCCSA